MLKFNTKYFLIGLIIIPAINYKTFYNFNSTSTTTSTGTTVTVATGSIKNTIEVSGDAELVDEQSLKFTKQGTVTKVNFSAGDTVSKGDIIAELDNSDAESSIENAQISLNNANISYSQLFDTPDESKILQDQNSITSAQNDLTIAQKQYDTLTQTQQNSLDQLEKSLETSKADLETAKNNLTLAKQQLETLKKQQSDSLNTTVSNKSTTVINIENSFKTYLNEIDNIIEQSDYIMGVTEQNKDKSSDFQIYLGARNLSIKSKASSSLTEAISLYDTLKSDVNSYDYSGDKTEITSLLKEFSSMYSQLSTTTDLIYQTLDNSVENDGVLSDSEIDSKKSTMSGYRTTAQSKVSTIASTLNTLDTLTNTDLVSESNSNTIASSEASIASSEVSIAKQENDIENSEKTLETTKATYKTNLEQSQNSIDQKEKTLKLAKISLEELMDGPTDDEVQKAKNTIKQAELSLQSAEDSLDDYKLEAPFDGVLRKIDYMVGDNITTDTDEYAYIENPDLIVITVMLDEIDITNVKVGQEADVVFDSYSTTTVKGEVSSIDTEPQETSGVVSYEVKVSLTDSSFDKKILSGMGADISIVTASKDNILVLKTSAITTESGSSYVTLLKNGQETKTEVVTGISGDSLTEIASGLSAGDQVIIKDYSSATSSGSTSSSSSSTSLFGGGGGGSSGPSGGGGPGM